MPSRFHGALGPLVVALFGALASPPPCSAAEDAAPEAKDAALEVVAEGLNYPVNTASPDDGSERIFVAELYSGKVRVVRDGELLPDAFLDIGDRITEVPQMEDGLLSLAFPPGFPDDRHVYVTYTGNANDLVLSRFRIAGDTGGASASSEEVLLSVDRLSPFHHCGHIEFGPTDGLLYMCVGDTDRPGNPSGSAQDRGTLAGSILRLDVVGGAGRPYAIPDDNPFVNVDGARPEIWALGLRNPWKFAFDPATGDLFTTDVGNRSWEEVNLLKPGGEGANLGWARAEGNDCIEWQDCADDGLHWPLFEYPRHEPHCSIVGGAVYRGERFPDWSGVYVFGDFCSGAVWALRDARGRPSIRTLLPVGSLNPAEMGTRPPVHPLSSLAAGPLNPTGMGTDHDGEILITDGPAGKLYRLRFPDDASAGWRPADEVMGEQAMRARRAGHTAPADALRGLKSSRRWTWTQRAVDLYNSLGRPLD